LRRKKILSSNLPQAAEKTDADAAEIAIKQALEEI